MSIDSRDRAGTDRRRTAESPRPPTGRLPGRRVTVDPRVARGEAALDVAREGRTQQQPPRISAPHGETRRLAKRVDLNGALQARRQHARRDVPSTTAKRAATHAPDARRRRTSGGAARHQPATDRVRDQRRAEKHQLRRPPRLARQPRFSFTAGDAPRRLRAVLVVSVLMLVAIVVRVGFLQTAQASTYRAAGRSQRISESPVKAPRGAIFDRTGNELALSIPAVTIVANPKQVLDPASTVRVLAALLQLTDAKQQALTTAFATKDKGFVYVARQIDDQLANTIMALKLPGIESQPEDRRVIPSGDVGKSLIGKVNPDNEGSTGLELQYDQLLTGTDGERVREHDRAGRSIPGSDVTAAPAVPGDDIVLTVDRPLQYQVEQALVARVEGLKAKGGVAIVMDPSTGQIYAAANVRRTKEGTVEVTAANLAAVEAYEPGSVAKVFSLSGAINEGIVTPDSVEMVPGQITFNRGTRWVQTITDAEPHGTIPYTVHDIIVHSSNIGTLKVAEKLGPDKLSEYLHLFGFGAKTSLDFPNETAGQLKPVIDWQGTEKQTLSFGYGFAASPLQLIAAVNTVANGGVYVSPKLVDSTIDSTGTHHETAPSPSHRVLSTETATTMTSMMKDVVCYGTAKLAQVPGITVAGKTGTGYKRQANGTYTNDDGTRAYFASFVGYLPADHPKVTILVSIDEPDPTTRERFGGTASAPLWANIAQAAIHSLQITPEATGGGCPKSAG